MSKELLKKAEAVLDQSMADLLCMSNCVDEDDTTVTEQIEHLYGELSSLHHEIRKALK